MTAKIKLYWDPNFCKFCNGSNKSFSDRLTCSYWEHIKPHSEPHQSNPLSQSDLVVHGEAYTIHSTTPSSIIRQRNPMMHTNELKKPHHPMQVQPQIQLHPSIYLPKEYHIHLIPLDQVPSFFELRGLGLALDSSCDRKALIPPLKSVSTVRYEVKTRLAC